MLWRALTEVARHAGHGLAVLLRVYANCIDGQGTANRIGDASMATSQADASWKQPARVCSRNSRNFWP